VRCLSKGLQKLLRQIQLLFRTLRGKLLGQQRDRRWRNHSQGKLLAVSPKLPLSWVLPGRLAVGPLPKPGDEAALQEAGVRVILSLCAELEGTLPEVIRHNFECYRYVLPDSHYPEKMTLEQLTEVVDLVTEVLEERAPLYIHCLAGMERSPTVCIAYLCRAQKQELWETMAWFKQIHPPTMLSDSQFHLLRSWSGL